MSNLHELAEIAPKTIWEGIRARMVDGERMTLTVVELPVAGLVPQHQHANEQIGMVVEGSVTFTVGDESRRLGPGGSWRIPGGVPHVCVAGDAGAVVVEVFSPPRADWRELAPEAAGRPKWPRP